MTPLALDAAAHEIESYAHDLGALVVTLRRLASVVEASSADLPPAAPSRDAPPPSVPAVPDPRPRAAGAAVTRQVSRVEGTDAQLRILEFIRTQTTSVSLKRIATCTRLACPLVTRTLRSLVQDGHVLATGQTFARRYVIAQIATGPDAGTRAGSARGSGPRRTAEAASVEIAWNGTKERTGDAPSLLPPREQKR